MKIALAIVVLLVLGGMAPVMGQTNLEFGYQFHPEKLLENTEGVLHVYVLNGGKISPTEINGLKVSSSDNSIVKVLEITKTDNFSTEIKILALGPGTANLSLAAPGIKSLQIPITVYNNNNYPTQLLLKTTPNDFPVDGPKFGYIGIELATTGNLPTAAPEDTLVKISTPNTDVIKLEASEILIPKGEYYAITQFTVRGSGDAIVFAESDGMKKINEFIHVREAKTPLQLQLYVFPKNFNSYNSQIGYAVVQLQDSEGIPVKSDKDIKLKIGVENPDSGINTSHDFEEILFENKELTIQEGKYSTYSSFSVRPNVADFTSEFEQTYDFFIIADDHIAKSDSITITHDEIGSLEGKGPAITRTLPFLTTGEQELLGISYFETEIEVSRKTGTSTLGVTDRETATITVPVMASEDLFVNVASSNLETVDPDNILFKKGKNAGLLFGNTGTVIPEDGTALEFYVTDNKKSTTVVGDPNGPLETDLNLTVEPLIPKILANAEFPLIGYLIEQPNEDEDIVSEDDEEEEDGRIGVTQFTKDSVLTFTANENFDIPPQIISQNQEYAIVNAQANKIGASVITAQAAGLDTSTSLESHTTDPARIGLSFSQHILPMTKNIATIQLLDSVGNPVYAKESILFEIVSNNENSIKIPELIQIKKGEYFQTFEIDAHSEGTTEITILAEDLPMANYELFVEGIHPEVSIMSANSIDEGNPITAELQVNYPDSNLSVENLEVLWDVLGGKIVQSDTITNSDGKAQITIDEIASDNLEIHATVNGLGFTNHEVSKKINVIPITITEEAVVQDITDNTSFDNNVLLFIIPGAAGGAFFYLKKTNRLEDISEKYEEIKERISDIRDR